MKWEDLQTVTYIFPNKNTYLQIPFEILILNMIVGWIQIIYMSNANIPYLDVQGVVTLVSLITDF